jgi:hypothetical protein
VRALFTSMRKWLPSGAARHICEARVSMLRAMHLRTCAGMIAIVAAIAACKKTGSEGGSGTAAGSGSAASAGSAGATTGSGSADGSGANAGSAGAGSAGGSSPATGSAAGSNNAGSGSAAAGGGSADADYDKAAFLEDPLCEQVADKIRACADKPEFIAALDDGADAQQKKVNARLRKGVKKWQKAHELCTNAWDIINYEYTGFLDRPVVFKAPNALASCAELGAAVKAGGGLVGGDTAE